MSSSSSLKSYPALLVSPGSPKMRPLRCPLPPSPAAFSHTSVAATTQTRVSLSYSTLSPAEAQRPPAKDTYVPAAIHTSCKFTWPPPDSSTSTSTAPRHSRWIALQHPLSPILFCFFLPRHRTSIPISFTFMWSPSESLRAPAASTQMEARLPNLTCTTTHSLNCCRRERIPSSMSLVVVQSLLHPLRRVDGDGVRFATSETRTRLQTTRCSSSSSTINRPRTVARCAATDC